MHALLCTSGSTGDFLPLLGLAKELQKQGMTPALAVAGSYRKVVEGLGFEFVELFTAEQHKHYTWERSATKGIARAKVGMRRIVEDIDPAFRFVQKYVEKYGNQDVLVVSTAWMVGTRIAQEVFDVPLANVHLQPMAVRSIQHCPPGTRWLARGVERLADRWIDGQIADGINAYRGQYGLAPAQNLLREWWLSPDLVVGLFPDWLSPPQSDWPPQLHLAGFQWNDQLEPVADSETVRLEEFVSAGSPPIVFSRCSALDYASSYFSTCIAAAQELGKRAVILTPNEAEIPADLGGNVLHMAYYPLSKLLPGTCLHVHHGGIGTVAQSFRAGTPQLIIPQFMDQPDNAKRVKGLQAGEILSPQKVSLPRVVDKLRKLLDSPTIHERCRELAGRCESMDGLRDGAQLIGEMLAARQPATVAES